MPLTTIKKRNGTIVDFNAGKVSAAVRKAFTAVRGGVADHELYEITTSVMNNLEARFGDTLFSVEDVQNHVEQVLMGKGFVDFSNDRKFVFS
jgi:ribonucleoside-diphosphate reductase alpha chain